MQENMWDIKAYLSPKCSIWVRTCQLFLFDKIFLFFQEKMINILPLFLYSDHLLTVKYMKNMNVPLFCSISPICSFLLFFNVGRYEWRFRFVVLISSLSPDILIYVRIKKNFHGFSCKTANYLICIYISWRHIYINTSHELDSEIAIQFEPRWLIELYVLFYIDSVILLSKPSSLCSMI